MTAMVDSNLLLGKNISTRSELFLYLNIKISLLCIMCKVMKTQPSTLQRSCLFITKRIRNTYITLSFIYFTLPNSGKLIYLTISTLK